MAFLVATTSLPAVDRPNADRWNAACSRQKKKEQAGTELGQSQLKLGLDCTVIFCRFGFSSFGLIELV